MLSAGSFCLLVRSILLSWVICYFWHSVEMLRPDSSVVLYFSKLGLYLLPLQSLYSFDNLSKCTLFAFLTYFISAAPTLLPYITYIFTWAVHIIDHYVVEPVVFGQTAPQWTRASLFTKLLDHTQRHTTVRTTPLDEWSARRRDLYLTTHSTQTEKPLCPRWDSNPQSQQVSGRRPTP